MTDAVTGGAGVPAVPFPRGIVLALADDPVTRRVLAAALLAEVLFGAGLLVFAAVLHGLDRGSPYAWPTVICVLGLGVIAPGGFLITAVWRFAGSRPDALRRALGADAAWTVFTDLPTDRAVRAVVEPGTGWATPPTLERSQLVDRGDAIELWILTREEGFRQVLHLPVARIAGVTRGANLGRALPVCTIRVRADGEQLRDLALQMPAGAWRRLRRLA